MAEASKRTSTSRSTASKRASMAPAAPKPPSSIHSAATVADKASLVGVFPITISSRAIIHPYARVVSAEGSVSIGSGCIIAERATVGPTSQHGNTTLDDNVIVETNAIVQGARVGSGTIVETFARIEEGATVGKACKICCYGIVAAGTAVPDFSVVYGNNLVRADDTTKASPLVAEIRALAHEKHIQSLQRLVPSNLAKFQ